VGLRYFSCGSHVCPLGHTFPSARGVVGVPQNLNHPRLLSSTARFRGTPFCVGSDLEAGKWLGAGIVSAGRPSVGNAGTTQAQSGAREEHENAGRLLDDIEKTIKARNDLRSEFAKDKPEGSDSQHKPAASRPDRSDDFVAKSQPLQEWIAKTCAEALKYLQPKWWGEEGLMLREVGSKDGDEEKNITVVCGKDKKDDEEEKEPSLSTRLAERFVALVYLNFILVVLLRMRTLGIAVAGLYVFLLLSVNSYPFEPRTALRSAAILLLLFIIGIVGYVCAEAHRDSILSLVTQTKPGELGIQFWLRMGSLFALPLISLLVSQFPSLNNVLFSWLEPAVNALK